MRMHENAFSARCDIRVSYLAENEMRKRRDSNMNTKRIIGMLLIIGIILTSFVSVGAAEDLELIINGVRQTYSLTSVSAGISNNQILAPACELAAALGAGCSENGDSATITKDGMSLTFTKDSASVATSSGTISMSPAPQLISGKLCIPAEFVGSKLGYRVFRERAGNRVRIVSRTGITAPALKEKSGMAELVSEVHRPVPTSFAKSNELSVDNLIYAKEDYSDALGDKSVRIGAIPTGDVIFSQQDFMNELVGLSHVQYIFSAVDVTEKYETNLLSMNVRMSGQSIGEGKNSAKPLPFTKAVRVNSRFEVSNPFAAKIEFGKQLPSPEFDDNYVLSYYARIIEGGDPDYGYGKISFSVYGNGTSSLEKVVEITPEWKRYDFLLTGKEG